MFLDIRLDPNVEKGFDEYVIVNKNSYGMFVTLLAQKVYVLDENAIIAGDTLAGDRMRPLRLEVIKHHDIYVLDLARTLLDFVDLAYNKLGLVLENVHINMAFKRAVMPHEVLDAVDDWNVSPGIMQVEYCHMTLLKNYRNWASIIERERS